jgi:hypothetical protein
MTQIRLTWKDAKRRVVELLDRLKKAPVCFTSPHQGQTLFLEGPKQFMPGTDFACSFKEETVEGGTFSTKFPNVGVDFAYGDGCGRNCDKAHFIDMKVYIGEVVPSEGLPEFKTFCRICFVRYVFRVTGPHTETFRGMVLYDGWEVKSLEEISWDVLPSQAGEILSALSDVETGDETAF